jgi:hypothetical protein
MWLYAQSAAYSAYAAANYLAYTSAFSGQADGALGEDFQPAAVNPYFERVARAGLPDLGGADRRWSHQQIGARIAVFEQEFPALRHEGLRVLFDPTTYQFFWVRPTVRGQAIAAGSHAEPLPAPVKLTPPTAEQRAQMSAQERAAIPPDLGAPVGARDDAALRRELGALRERHRRLRLERHLDIVYDRAAQQYIWVIAPEAATAGRLPALPAPVDAANTAAIEQQLAQLRQTHAATIRDRRATIVYDRDAQTYVWVQAGATR